MFLSLSKIVYVMIALFAFLALFFVTTTFRSKFLEAKTSSCIDGEINQDDSNKGNKDDSNKGNKDDSNKASEFCTTSCDDGNFCTDDKCSNNICTNVLKSCNDSNLCTVDSCDPSIGCIYHPVICYDDNSCTADGCKPMSGCVHINVSCDDKIDCTIDICTSSSGCEHIPRKSDSCAFYVESISDPNPLIICKDTSFVGDTYNDKISSWICGSNAKAVVYMDKDYGGSSMSIGCGEKAVYLDSTWNDKISSVKISSCPSDCTISCDDGNFCTDDKCSNNTCTNVLKSCNDSNLCTVDSCDPSIGCIYNRINCDDNDSCTTDACFPMSGCVHINVSCDDKNPGTIDRCTSSGCEHIPRSSSDSCAFYVEAISSPNPLILFMDTSFVGEDYNDKISSLDCGSNAKAVVYMDKDYGGSSMSIGCDEKVEYLDSTWNDKISSVKIFSCK